MHYSPQFVYIQGTNGPVSKKEKGKETRLYFISLHNGLPAELVEQGPNDHVERRRQQGLRVAGWEDLGQGGHRYRDMGSRWGWSDQSIYHVAAGELDGADGRNFQQSRSEEMKP